MTKENENLEFEDNERKLLRVLRLEMIVDKKTLARFIPAAYLAELYSYIDEADEVEMRFKINSANISIFP